MVLNADDGQILDVNPCFVELCKCSRDEVIGKQIWETGLFDLTPELRDLLSESQQRETVRYDAIRLNARDGKRIETEMICNRYASRHLKPGESISRRYRHCAPRSAFQTS